MTAFDPRPDETLREALARYFDANQFGPHGRYDERWVNVKLGPATVSIPNTKGRVRAVRFHDLHHVVTGYDTDLRGEAEIAAWEIASGYADHYAAWVLNLGAMSIGSLFVPRRTWHAFLRGRRTKNLYRETYDETLLDRTVADVQAALGLDRLDLGKATAEDVGMFTAGVIAASMTGTALVLLKAPVAAFLILASIIRRQTEMDSAPSAEPEPA